MSEAPRGEIPHIWMLIEDHLKYLRDKAITHGPQAWGESWNRVVDVVSPLWSGKTLVTANLGEEPVQQARALAMAMYLASAQHGIPPAAVTRAHSASYARRASWSTGKSC